jgi:hypothetical protein
VGWDGEGRERKGEEGRDGKRAGGKYCFMAVGGDGRQWVKEGTAGFYEWLNLLAKYHAQHLIIFLISYSS